MNTANTQRKVIVVGAGLAGLSAAYELLKTGKYSVQVIEALDYAGGRVHSLPINGQMVDFGGFIIYPWYEQYHRLLNELNIAAELTPIAMKPIFYEIGEHNEFVQENDLKFPAADTVKLWAKSAPSIFMNSDIAEPKLDTYYDKTISQYLRETLGRPEYAGIYEAFTDLVSQGYCYGPVDEYRAAFITPIIRYTKLYGDIKSAFYFRNGNVTIAEALARSIEILGGTIHYNEPVVSYSDGSVTTTKQTYTADAFVFAQPVTKELYSQILPQVEIEAKYTHFYAAVVRFDKPPTINGEVDWGGAFYKADPMMPYQILSAINLTALYGDILQSYVTVNIRVSDDAAKEQHPLSQQEIHERIKTDIADRFPGSTCLEVVDFVHWPRTMPIVTEGFVREIRKRQGENNLFFAGDYLGGPSMETALQTGVRAANAITTIV